MHGTCHSMLWQVKKKVSSAPMVRRLDLGHEHLPFASRRASTSAISVTTVFAAPKLRSVDSTAASTDNSFLQAVDATAASFSDGELQAVVFTAAVEGLRSGERVAVIGPRVEWPAGEKL